MPGISKRGQAGCADPLSRGCIGGAGYETICRPHPTAIKNQLATLGFKGMASLVPRPHPKKKGKGFWGLASVFLVVHQQQFCFQVNQSDHSFGTVI